MANFIPQEIEQFLQEFFDVVGTRQYIGARYVPLFGRKGEETMSWDEGAAPYEPLTIVIWQGDSYTSRQYVPAGIDIENVEYWAKTGNFNGQVEEYKRIVENFAGQIDQIGEDVEGVKEILPYGSFTPEITVQNYIDNTRVEMAQTLVPFPISPDSKLGTEGQILSTLANGLTRWINPISPTDEQAAEAISAWLDDHPEATTTVQDGSITTAKLRDGAVTNAKMQANSVVRWDEMSQRILRVLEQYDKAITDGAYQVRLNLADLPTFYHAGFMNADGTISPAVQHNIKLLPLTHVDGVAGVGTYDNTNLVGFIYQKQDGTYVYNKLVQSKICRLWAGGVDGVGFMLINHFDANVANPRNFINEIDVHLHEDDADLTYADNMLDPRRAFTLFDTCLMYSNGLPVYGGNRYVDFIVPVEEGVSYYRNPSAAHVVFLDADGEYISGMLSPGVIVPPTGCVTMAIAPAYSTLYANINWLSQGYSLGHYEPAYKLPLNMPRDAEFSGSDIHFTVEISDTALNDGAASGATDVDTYHTNNVNCVLRLPAAYRREGKPVPLIVITHGSGYGVSATAWGAESGGVIVNNADFRSLINTFVNAGFAVCDCNGFDNTTALRILGSPRGIYAYRKMIQYVMDTYNVEKCISVYGFSMGGIGAINLALAFRDIVRCVALASPIVALYEQAYSHSAAWKEYLANAYAWTVPEGFQFTDGAPNAEEIALWTTNVNKVKNYDAYANATAGKMHMLPPVRVWHGDQDTATEQSISAAFVAALRNDCNVPITLRTVTGAGHEICWGHNATINGEYLKWFKRFM